MRTCNSTARLARLTAACGLLLTAMGLRAQPVATNTCGYNVGNQYTVGSTCNASAFNKPDAFTGTYTPSPASCNSSGNDDAWGWFTATSTRTAISYDPTTNNRNPIIHVYTGTCTAGLVWADCHNAGGNNVTETFNMATVVGQNYMIRIQHQGANDAMNGNLCLWTPPANDLPCGAIGLTLGAGACTSITGTNANMTPARGIPAPGCASHTAATTADAWFSFVAPAIGAVTVETGAAGGMTNTGMALYSATSCTAGFTLIACNDDAAGLGLFSRIARTDLTPGATYYVRVWNNGATAAGSFTICAYTPPPPANDEPCGATLINVPNSCTTVGSTSLYATPSGSIADPPCGNYAGGDVWFRFVAPGNGVATIRTGTVTGGMANSAIALYWADACSDSLELVSCSADGNGAMGQLQEFDLTPGATYYVRVWGENGTTGAFNICAFTPVLGNDDPCGAINLTLNSSCAFSSQTTVGATVSAGIPAPGCGNGAYRDIWYRFTAPANGLVTFRATPGTLTNPQIAVYQASACSGPYTLVKCDNASGPGNAAFMTLTPLEIVPGETYYLRIWGNSNTVGTFNLCAFTAPATGDCIYVLRMWDSQGDGWGNSRVSIQVGAGPAVQYWNADADEEVAYIPVSTGQAVTLSYSTGGSGNQNQIRYALQLIYGPLYMDGPTPGTGLRWAGSANCVSPAPVNSDCVGGTPICGAQNVSANPSNTGLAVDLNLANRGCLSSSERQGMWFKFTVSASGTLGFTITPNNLSDDYDFAVYGPYVNEQCPPQNLPVRCNWSGITGATGLSAAGTNPSEGSGGSKWSSLLPVTVGQRYLLYVSNYTQSGLAFDLTWQLTGGASLDCTLLPVELVSLTGAPVPAGVRLEWLTASESNSAFFAVERQDELGAFQQIGTVAAMGSTSSTTTYTFIDEQPLSGFNYYRLKMVDLDGSTKLSDVVAVMHRFGTGIGMPFPNPAEDRISVQVELEAEQAVTLAAHDAAGRLVREHTITAASGAPVVSMPLHGLESGQYLLTVSTREGGSRPAGRFVVR